MIDVLTYNGPEAGPTLALTGAVHGNEVCGTKALQRLARGLAAGEVVLKRGHLRLIPIANPAAYAQNKRFVEVNLNRVFRPHDVPMHYEHHVANELCAALQGVDVLVDFHSIHSKGEPFVLRFADVPPAEDALLQALGLPVMISGWAEAYARSLPGVDMGQDVHSHAYVRSLGGIAAGVECGQHDDPAAIEVAYQAARRALVHLGLVEGALSPMPLPRPLRIEQVVFSPTGRDDFAREFIHGEAVTAGELIGRTGEGAEVRAPHNALILFPRPQCPKGEEWFYLGQKE